MQFDAASQSTGLFTHAHVCSGEERVLYVWIFFDSANPNLITSFKYDGVDMSLVGQANGVVYTNGHVACYKLINPNSGNHDITLNNLGTYCSIVALSYKGADQVTNPETFSIYSEDGLDNHTLVAASNSLRAWFASGLFIYESTGRPAEGTNELTTRRTYTATNGELAASDSDGAALSIGFHFQDWLTKDAVPSEAFGVLVVIKDSNAVTGTHASAMTGMSGMSGGGEIE